MADELKPQLIVFHTGGTVVAEIEEVGADMSADARAARAGQGRARHQRLHGGRMLHTA